MTQPTLWHVHVPGGVTCPACGRHHDHMCRKMRDALWSIVKDKRLRGRHAQDWARAALGLGE